MSMMAQPLGNNMRHYGQMFLIRQNVSTNMFAYSVTQRRNRSSHTLLDETVAETSNLRVVTEKTWKDLPGPRSFPFIGTLYKYLPGAEYHNQNRIDGDVKKLAKYGDIVKEEVFPGQVFIHLFDPDDVQEVYRHEGKYPFRGELQALVKYRTERGINMDIGSAKGEMWRRMRFPVTKEMLNPKIVQQYIHGQDGVALDLVSVIREKRDENTKLISIMPELWKFSIDAVSLVIFNKRLEMMKSSMAPHEVKIFESLHHTFEGLHQCVYYWPLHKNGKTKVWKNFVEASDFIAGVSEKLTTESLRKTDKKPNFIQRLQSRGINEVVAADLSMSLLFAAVDTTANSLYFLLYNLAKNPDKQRILYESIRDTYPDETRPVTDLIGLSYLRACIRESFRLLPTTPGTLRILDKDIVLKNYKIPAGMTFLFGSGVICRREDIFDCPDEYRPERWLRGYNPKPHAFANLPFSHGIRGCPGKRFSEQEIMLAIIRILQKFKLEYEGPPLKVKSKLLLTPMTDSLKLVDRVKY